MLSSLICGFSDVVAEYGDEMLKLSHIILAVLSRHSNLPEDYILQRLQETKPGGVRTGMNYYPPCPQPDLVMGLSPHADGSVVTIVQQDGVSGLEVLKDEMWVPVPPVPNALVINIGDQIQVTHIPDIAFLFKNNYEVLVLVKNTILRTPLHYIERLQRDQRSRD